MLIRKEIEERFNFKEVDCQFLNGHFDGEDEVSILPNPFNSIDNDAVIDDIIETLTLRGLLEIWAGSQRVYPFK